MAEKLFKKGALKGLAITALGIQVAILLFPLWSPLLLVYWILERPIKFLRDCNFSRIEWLSLTAIALSIYGIIKSWR